MKKILFLLFLLISILQIKASDTLTVGQVFNFNVGDTFDYQITLNIYDGNTPPTFNGNNYERYVIVAKTSSANNDTITYTRQQLYPNIAQIDQLIYFNLDSPVWFAFDTPVTAPYFQLDTGKLNDGRITNTLNFDGLTIHNYCEYGEGLGVYDTIYGSFYYLIANSDPDQYMGGSYEKTLIYFSKGTEQYGTPYYQAIGPNLSHFTPIPEDCAFWNYYSGYYSGTSQIRTGNKIFLNNHTYVELLYRTFFNNQLSNDTLIGYFRNDTLGRKVYFTPQPDTAERVLYDFTLTDSSQIYGSNYYYTVTVDTTSIGGINRAEWFQETVTTTPNDFVFGFYTYLEGIGATTSLFFDPDGFSGCACVINLTSFCVCGETLYPDTATGQCSLLTAISNISSNNPQIYLYPNPTSDILHLSFTDMGQYNTQFIITDILGEEVYSSVVTQSETTHDISHLSAGIYTWRIVVNNNAIKTGKVVKE